MSVVQRLLLWAEKASQCLSVHRNIARFVPFIALCYVVLNMPSSAIAANNNASRLPNNNHRTDTTELNDLSAEQMIAEMVMAIESPLGKITEDSELTDNPNPTSLFSSIPNIKPVAGEISSLFGSRLHPIYNVELFHGGIDIAAPEGSSVQTTGDGIVAFVGYDKGYGQKVTINHGYGYKTIYAHLSKIIVQQGDTVKRGDTIALSGNTGVSTGAHLHYEVVKNNGRVNPTTYFFDDSQHSLISAKDNKSLQKQQSLIEKAETIKAVERSGKSSL